MVDSRTTRRTAPSVLLIGLILLVAPHLLGALHGPGFVGSHQPLTAVGAAQPVAVAKAAATGSDHGHGHGHGHEHEDTVAHAVDRVRGTAGHPVDAPQIVEPVTGLPVTSASPGHADPRDGVPGPPGGRSACARHCIWRQ